MHNNIYIDTNIIVDIFDAARPFHKASFDILHTCFENEGIELFINSDTLSNLFYIMRAHMKLGLDDALEKLEYIHDAFSVIYTDDTIFETTLELCKKHIFKDYEDALQFVSAANANCTLIITNNPKDFKNSSIEVVTSKELCRLWERL